MTEQEIERDAFLQLLTDALRAGPGSPQWRAAVQQLRADGRGERDEYAMILEAREHLESGKEYRSIAAGPGFTRKVMGEIEKEPEGGRRGAPVASLVAVISVLVLVGVVGLVGYLLVREHTTEPRRDDLSGVTFTMTTALSSFDAAPIPQGWRAVGELKLEPAGGLRPAPAPAGDAVLGGALVSTLPQPADQPFAVEVTFDGPSAGEVIAQVFVTDQPEFSADRATSKHELVFSLQGEQAQVILPTGRVEATAAAPGGAARRVRIAVGRSLASIDLADRRLWTGEHQLAHDKPRTLGVRFLGQPTGERSRLAITSVRILRPQP